MEEENNDVTNAGEDYEFNDNADKAELEENKDIEAEKEDKVSTETEQDKAKKILLVYQIGFFILLVVSLVVCYYTFYLESNHNNLVMQLNNCSQRLFELGLS